MIEKHIIQVFICVFLYFMYVCLCLLIFVHHMKVWLFRSQMGSNPLKLGLQAVLSCHVCVGNQTVFLWKSSQRAKELSNLSSPIPFFLFHLFLNHIPEKVEFYSAYGQNMRGRCLLRVLHLDFINLPFFGHKQRYF